MSDENDSNVPSTPAGTPASPGHPATGEPRRIRIGSQREGGSTGGSSEMASASQGAAERTKSRPASTDIKPRPAAASHASPGEDDDAPPSLDELARIRSPQDLVARTGSDEASASSTAPIKEWSSEADGILTTPKIPRISAELQAEIDEALGDLDSLDALLKGEARPTPETAKALELDQRVLARVIKVDRESIFFSLGGPHQGVTPVRNFENPPEVGAQLEVVPSKYLVEDELYEVIVPGAAVEVQDWSDVSEGVVVDARVTGHNKGGLECEVNRIRAFMPVSQVSNYRVENLEPYVGQTLRAVVTEANPERRNLVLSHRAILERERQEAREKLMAELAVGQIREGVIKRLQPFGVFVDLGGVDGLIPLSLLSWDRVRDPKDVVEEGQRVKVRVEKIDPATGKIGLSYRDLLYDPWGEAAKNYAVGSIVDGTVSKIMEFGAFVKLAPGVEGLVHISELAHHRVHKVNSVVQEGQTVRVKILSMDLDAQRLSLSLKATQAAPGSDKEETEEAAEEAPARKIPVSNKPLQGGLTRRSEGDKFGLKW